MDQSVESLPIDIHCSRLLDWLLSRRHCDKEWLKKVVDIRKMIDEVIKNMPENEKILQLLKDSYINYFHCREIVDILKETEGSKNIFGIYSSQRLNDWVKIVQMYEKNNSGLAEAAMMLSRLVQLEIPDLKRQILKFDQKLAGLSTSEKSYERLATEARKQYEKELAKMGISGKNIRSELFDLAIDSPNFLSDIAKQICTFKEIVDYFCNFHKYLHDGDSYDVSALPLIRTLIDKGVDVTVYEWKNREKPRSIEVPSYLSPNRETESSKPDEIDFGDADAISFGDEAKTDFIRVDYDDLGFEVIDGNVEPFSHGVARGNEALTLLENPETQRIMIGELRELEKFLFFRRVDEESETSSDIYIYGLENRPCSINKISVSRIVSWLTQVQNVSAKLLDPQKSHFYKIRSSPHYMEVMIQKFESKRSLEERYRDLAKISIANQTEVHASKIQAEIQLKNVVNSTCLLQKQIENEIAKKYSGRIVNIMGGIASST